jgi:P27 family predicted phage terminase small subunit
MVQFLRALLRFKSIFLRQRNTARRTSHKGKFILKKSTAIKPPAHLRKSTQEWWTGINAEYELESHHLKLLSLAAEAWDRATTARETLAEHGIFYTDRWGAPRKHPAVSVAEAATIAFARLCRELDLNEEDSSPGESRPPALRSNR